MPKIWQKMKKSLVQLALKPISPCHFQTSETQVHRVPDSSLLRELDIMQIGSFFSDHIFCVCMKSFPRQRTHMSSSSSSIFWHLIDRQVFLFGYMMGKGCETHSSFQQQTSMQTCNLQFRLFASARQLCAACFALELILQRRDSTTIILLHC